MRKPDEVTAELRNLGAFLDGLHSRGQSRGGMLCAEAADLIEELCGYVVPGVVPGGDGSSNICAND